MNLTRGYSQDILLENVKELEKAGADESTALAVAIAYARGIYKQEHDGHSFPAYLTPGKTVKMFREFKDGEVNGGE